MKPIFFLFLFFLKIASFAQQNFISQANSTSLIAVTQGYEQYISNINHKGFLELWYLDKDEFCQSPSDTIHGRLLSVDSAAKWVSVKSGYSFFLALNSDGTIWAAGENDAQQCGSENKGAFIFKQVGNDHDWKSIFPFGKTSFAIKRNNSLWVWGDLSVITQKGIVNNHLSSIPVQTGNNANDWKSISENFESGYVLALKTNGTLWLMPNANDTLSKPLMIGNDLWKVIFNDRPVKGIKADGSLWVWANRLKADGTYNSLNQEFADYGWINSYKKIISYLFYKPVLTKTG